MILHSSKYIFQCHINVCITAVLIIIHYILQFTYSAYCSLVTIRCSRAKLRNVFNRIFSINAKKKERDTYLKRQKTFSFANHIMELAVDFVDVHCIDFILHTHTHKGRIYTTINPSIYRTILYFFLQILRFTKISF